MKVKKYINQEINGFLILDTYVKMTPNGKKTRKVLLKCSDCGREFERESGVDFDHVKCKCKCSSYPKKSHIKYTYNGFDYLASELCRMHGVPEATFSARIKRGATLEEALTGKAIKICPICGKQFEGDLATICCSQTCKNRRNKKKGKYKKIELRPCVICGKEFESNHYNAKTCSKECRNYRDRIIRNSRYKSLKEKGSFDESVTLNNVFDKYDGKCQACKKLLSFDSDWLSDDYPSIDHIIPLSKGGTHTWDNVQLLCRKCNCIKSDKIFE